VLRRPAALALLMVSTGVPTVGGSPRVSSQARLLDAAGLIHDGRFDEADETLAAVRERSPGDPAAAFFSALVTYWRLLYDDENTVLMQTLEERLLGAAAVAESSRSADHDAGWDVWGGYSRLFLAQLHASRKKPWAAVKEGRAARRLLGSASDSDPGSAEPLCGLGTYNYYADRVSAIVKGVRFLLGLPPGDRELGLDQLERAGRGSVYFALESRLILAAIYSGRHERLYFNAETQAEKALALEPQSVAVLDAAARLYLSLGNTEDAWTLLDRARSRAAGSRRTDLSVLAALVHQSARVEFSRFRPDRALELLLPLEHTTLPPRLKREVASLSAASRRLIGAVSTEPPTASGSLPSGLQPELWNRLRMALETERSRGAASAADELLRLLDHTPGEPTVGLLAGRALLLSGRAAQALERLDRADASRSLPPEWVGPCRLLAGQAADLAGRREDARDRYRSAIKAPPFIERNAAYLHVQFPYRPRR